MHSEFSLPVDENSLAVNSKNQLFTFFLNCMELNAWFRRFLFLNFLPQFLNTQSVVIF